MTGRNAVRVGVLWAVVLVIASLAGCAMWGHHRERCELSLAAVQAVKAAFPNAAVTDVCRECDGETKACEVEMKEQGKEFTVSVTADGAILEVETEIAMTDVPKAAADAIQAAAKGGKVKEVARVETRAKVADGKVMKLDQPTISYSAELVQGEKKAEIDVAADGTVLKPPVWKEAEKEKGGKDKDKDDEKD